MNSDKKKIMLIGYNYAPEPTGIGKYSGEMMEWLADQGHDCTVITTYPYYPYWKVQEPYRSRRFFYSVETIKKGDCRLKILRCPVYVPTKPSGLKRMVQDATFFISSMLAVIHAVIFYKKHDATIAVAPSFMVGFPALLYRLLRRNKIVYHIQDLQIEAAEQLGLIKSKGLLKILYGLERFVLNRVNAVSSISEAMIAKVRAKTATPVLFFPNWTDTNFFKPIEDRSGLKAAFGIDSKKKVILYSGAIGNKQGLEVIIQAASELDEDQYHFIICGTGPYKEVLERQVKEKSLNNLEFKPLQPLEKFNDFLNMADLHLVIQKSDASDLLLPSKLTSILSVGGLALITAQEGTSLYDLDKKYNLAVLIEPENEKAFIDGVLEAFSDEESTYLKKVNARKYAEQFLNKEKIMENFLHQVGEL